jgi:hypothetical protein
VSGERASSPGLITSLARGASDECDTAVALPLTAVSSQNVIGSFEARFFCAPAGKNEGAGAQYYVTPQVVMRFSANTLSLASGA